MKQSQVASKPRVPKRPADSIAARANNDRSNKARRTLAPRPRKNLGAILGFGVGKHSTMLMDGEVRWNEGEANDIWYLVHRHPAAVDRIEAFRSMAMCKPFRLSIGYRNGNRKNWKPAPMQPMMEEVVQINVMPFLYDMTLWVDCFGICPFFYEPIKGTEHFRPWVPVFGSGYITTYFDNDTRKQRFRWWWAAGRNKLEEVDETVGWITDGKPPTLSGSFRSSMSSVLEDYRHYRYGMRDNQYASFHSTHPFAVLTHNPPKHVTEDKDITHAIFGEAVSKELEYEDEEAAQEMHTFKAESMKRAMYEAGMLDNMNIASRMHYEGPVMASESAGRQYAREHNAYYDQRVIMPRDFNVARGPDYKPVIDLEKWDAILSGKICDALGIPAEMDKTSHGQKAVNKEGIAFSVGERLKRRIEWIEWVAEQIFLDIYGDTLQRGFNTYLNRNGKRYTGRAPDPAGRKKGETHDHAETDKEESDTDDGNNNNSHTSSSSSASSTSHRVHADAIGGTGPNGRRVVRPDKRKRDTSTLSETAVDSVLNAWLHVRVELHCTPMLNEAMALELYDRGFIRDEYMKTYLTDRYSFPERAIKRPSKQSGPIGAEFELKAAQQAFQQQMAQREHVFKEKLQRDELELKRQIQKDKHALELKKLKLQEKTLVEKAKADTQKAKADTQVTKADTQVAKADGQTESTSTKPKSDAKPVKKRHAATANDTNASKST